MATAGQNKCSSCKKDKRSYKCDECSQYFCLECLPRHEQELSNKFDRIEYTHDQIRQLLNDQKQDPRKHPSIMKIDQWERDSKKAIEQKANECRKTILGYTNQSLAELEKQLNDIAKNFQLVRQKNLFNEVHIREFQEKLDNLSRELSNSSVILIEAQSTSLINDIAVKYKPVNISPYSDAKLDEKDVVVW